MRPGQSRRTRSRSRSSKGPNPLTRSYESNGPDVKVRGTAQHVADKYAQLARDAQSSGDPVAAENYYQHAEHYYRIIAAAHDQFRQQYGGGYGQRPYDDADEDGDEDAEPNGFPYPNGERQGPAVNGGNGDFGQPQPYGTQPQPYESRGDDRSQRPDRGSERYDRGGGSDRYDRGSRPPDGGRPPERDRNDRSDRGSRPPERNERYERSDRDRQDRDRQDRGDPNARRDRDDRGSRPSERSDRTERSDRPERTERGERPERSDRVEPAPRPDTPRPDVPREKRDDTRRDGPRDERRREEAEGPTGLPAFLTNPVRPPIAVEEPVAEVPAPTEVAVADGEEAGRSSKPRRRRRTRYEGPGEEAPSEGAAPAADPTPVE